CFVSAGTMTFSYSVLSLGIYAFSGIDLLSGTACDTHLAFLDGLEPYPCRLAVLRIGERHVRNMDRRFLADDPALLRRGLPLMAADHVHAAHEHAIVLRAHLDHLAGPALVATGQHHDLVAFPDLRGHYS